MSEKPEARFAKAAWNLSEECAKLEAENERLREAMRSAMAMLDKHEPEPAGAFAVLLLALNPELQSAKNAALRREDKP